MKHAEWKSRQRTKWIMKDKKFSTSRLINSNENFGCFFSTFKLFALLIALTAADKCVGTINRRELSTCISRFIIIVERVEKLSGEFFISSQIHNTSASVRSNPRGRISNWVLLCNTSNHLTTFSSVLLAEKKFLKALNCILRFSELL